MTLDLPEAPELVKPVTDRGVLHRFEIELGALWPHVAPLCEGSGDETGGPTACGTSGVPTSGTEVHSLPTDLQALLAGWRHFDENRRTVLRAAVGFVSDESRHVHDEDVVVEAAVRALLRGDR